MPIIPAIRGLTTGKNSRLYLKYNEEKGLGVWLKWERTCLPGIRL
jgi:hypothetical protein